MYKILLHHGRSLPTNVLLFSWSTTNKSFSATLAMTNSMLIDGSLEGRLDVVANVLQILTCSTHGLRRGHLPCKHSAISFMGQSSGLAGVRQCQGLTITAGPHFNKELTCCLNPNVHHLFRGVGHAVTTEGHLRAAGAMEHGGAWEGQYSISHSNSATSQRA